MTQCSGNLIQVTALQITWSSSVSSNVDSWPFGLFLFYSTLRSIPDGSIKVQIVDAMFMLLLMWD